MDPPPMGAINNALIIGGAGFVGSYLAAELLRRGCAATAVIRSSTATPLLQDLAPAAGVRRVDAGDQPAMNAVFKELRPDAVFYVAGTPRARAKSVFDEFDAHLQPAVSQLLLTLRAAAESQQPPRVFVRTGTLAEYGCASTPHREDMRAIPATVYGVCALAGTRMLEIFENAVPFRIASARLALVYGWRQPESFLIPLMVNRFVRGQPVTVNDAEAVRDLIHVSDVCDGLIALAETDNFTSGPINVGSGEALSMREVAQTILTIIGAPYDLLQNGDPSLATGSQRLEMTTNRAAELIGWRARIRFRDGVQTMVDQARQAEGSK
jgi:nucleoside-diphosphate-sugar epimerase